MACRLYDPSQGRIRLDGVDLRELSLGDVSHWIAKVTQETTLFNATIEENLRYGRPEATRDEIERACQVAQVHDVIAALPQGYDTVGGEATRCREARAASRPASSRDPKVVIRRGHVVADSRSEALIQQALEPCSRAGRARHCASAQHDSPGRSHSRARQGPHRRAWHAHGIAAHSGLWLNPRRAPEQGSPRVRDRS